MEEEGSAHRAAATTLAVLVDRHERHVVQGSGVVQRLLCCLERGLDRRVPRPHRRLTSTSWLISGAEGGAV